MKPWKERKGGLPLGLSVLCLVLLFLHFTEGKWRQKDWDETEDDFNSVSTAEEKSAEARFQELQDWIQKGNEDSRNELTPLPVKRYLELIRPAPRNFSAFLLFQPLYDGRRGKPCHSCELAWRYWSVVGPAHNSHFQAGQEEEPPVFFFVVNFSKQKVKQLKLPVTLKQPNIYFFEASTAGKAWGGIRRFNVAEALEQEEGIRLRERIDDRDLTKWIKELSPVKVNLVRRIPPRKHVKGLTFLTGVGLYLMIRLIGFRKTINFMYRCWRAIRLMDYEHLIIVFILFCISGQFYNFIRGTPLAYSPASGGISLVARGNYQFGIESYIIMIIYGAIVLAMIQFTRNVDKSLKIERKTDEYKKWVFVFTVAFWGLMYMNMMKR